MSAAATNTGPASRVIRRALAFLGVGAVATAVYATLALVLSYGGILGPVGASATAYVVASVASYFGHRRVTFQASRRHAAAVPSFIGVALAGYALSLAIPAFLTGWLDLPAWVGVAVTCGCVPTVTYVCLGRFVFSGP